MVRWPRSAATHRGRDSPGDRARPAGPRRARERGRLVRHPRQSPMRGGHSRRLLPARQFFQHQRSGHGLAIGPWGRVGLHHGTSVRAGRFAQSRRLRRGAGSLIVFPGGGQLDCAEPLSRANRLAGQLAGGFRSPARAGRWLGSAPLSCLCPRRGRPPRARPNRIGAPAYRPCPQARPTRLSGGTGSILQYKISFEKYMDDDFNTPEALSVIFSMVKNFNKLLEGEEKGKQFVAAYAISVLREMTDTLNLNFFNRNIAKEKVPLEIKELLNERDEARASKDFQRSDELRDLLQEKGVIVEDTKDGQIWRRA